MRKKFQRLSSRAARWSPRFGGIGLMILLVACVLHRLGLIITPLLGPIAVIAGFFAACGFGCALKGFSDLWARGDIGGKSSIRGTVLSLMTLLPLIAVLAGWFLLPPLYDISTDLDNPPAYITFQRPADALPVRAVLSNQADEQLAAWPQMTGRRYDASPDRILIAVLAVLDGQGWRTVSQKGIPGEEEELLVEATAKTMFLGFVSDVVIRLTDEDGGTTFVDIRATSRYLSRDFGIDARFAMSFMDALDAQVLLTPIDQTDE